MWKWCDEETERLQENSAHLVLAALARLQTRQDLALDDLNPGISLLVGSGFKVPRLPRQRHDGELKVLLLFCQREREGEMKTHPDLTLTILIQKLRHQTVAKQNLKIRTTCGCSAEGCNDQLSLTLFDRTPVLLTYMTPPPVARISPKLRVPGPSCPLLCRHVSRRGQSLQSGPAGGGGGGIWICYTEPPQRLMGQSGANYIKYVRACCVDSGSRTLFKAAPARFDNMSAESHINGTVHSKSHFSKFK